MGGLPLDIISRLEQSSLCCGTRLEIISSGSYRLSGTIGEELKGAPMRKAVVIVCCLMALVLCACSGQTTQDETKNIEQEITPKALDDYSWEEISKISAEISTAASDEEGRAVAQKYGLVKEDGMLSDQTKMIVLNGKRALDVRIAGIRHDDKADGTGKAGITFMTVGAVDIRPMNEEDTIVGGWEASSLRAWLDQELPSQLENDLAQAIVPVSKLTNNVGITDSIEDVTPTADRLWVYSVHEVCGDVTWDIDEFRQRRGYEDVDGMVNAEGFQYEVFVQNGVSGVGDPNGFLSLSSSTGPSPWWYRTPYPFEWTNLGNTGVNGYFYRVMDTGYPESIGAPQDPSSVVVGFCV